MLPYQHQVVEAFTKMVPAKARNILEIGSDLGGEVVTALSQRTGGFIVGINPSPEFPMFMAPKSPNTFFLRSDGRFMPFADNSFDAVVSVATMEHVKGLDAFLTEVTRILKPEGLFFVEFAPIWSSAHGHHVYAIAGSKEARFWKPGRNPIPDYAHLLMTPEEMRADLRSGPCAEELIEPIIQWIYFRDSINRCHFEAYMESFRRCPLITQHIHLGYDNPDYDTLTKLSQKFGQELDFRCSSISAVFRKLPEGDVNRLFFKGVIFAWDVINRLGFILKGMMRLVRRAFAILFSKRK